MSDDREKLIDAMIDAVFERSGRVYLPSYDYMDIALSVAERALAEKFARIGEAADEIKKLRAALKPFAAKEEYCEGYYWDETINLTMKVDDLRAARAALGEKDG